MERWKELSLCFPEPPDWSADWKKIEQNSCLRELADQMKQTPQDPLWHGEGDVWTHTRMVCDTLGGMGGFRKLRQRQRWELFLAALLHDTGKIRCTREENGRLISPRHAAAGTHIARTLLWKELGMAGTAELQNFRETVCALIRYHTAPVYLGEKEDKRKLLRIAADGELSGDFQISMLCLLSRADVLGRLADDTEEMDARVALTELLAQELGCLEGPKYFSSAYTQRAYLNEKLDWPDGELYDDTWGEVILMCGLPGTGKDIWIREHCQGLPVVSLDEIRREMNIPPTGPQGPVAAEARERARRYLRAHKPFVWNAVNLTPDLREKNVRLFEGYKAAVRVVYLETGWEEELRRNRERGNLCPEKRIPEQKIARMLERLTPPERASAQYVEWLVL